MTDRFRIGQSVRVVRASAANHLVSTRAVILEARSWHNIKGPDGETYQMFGYTIRACNGENYVAEEHNLALWIDAAAKPWQDGGLGQTAMPAAPDWAAERQARDTRPQGRRLTVKSG